MSKSLSRRSPQCRTRLGCEPLEDRLTPSYYTGKIPSGSLTRGAIGIPYYNYPVPTQGTVYYVSPTGSGVSTNPAQPGSAKATLFDSGSSLVDGATVVFRGGDYRNLDAGSATLGRSLPNKHLTLQPYPGEQAWVLGSRVATDWTQSTVAVNGTSVTVWSTPWSEKFDLNRYGNFFESGDTSKYVDSANRPEAADLDMAFLNGVPLDQVRDDPTTSAVEGDNAFGSGEFWIGKPAGTTQQRLYIADNPVNRTVEVTAYGWGIASWGNSAPGTTIRGLGFAHFAYRAVSASSDHMTLENNTFAWNGFAGLDFNPYGTAVVTDAVVLANKFVANGMVGVEGKEVDRMNFRKNTVAYNNVEAFKTNWAAAGAKLTASEGVTFTKNFFSNNFASGLWLDINMIGTQAANNTFNGNTQGMHVELSYNTAIGFNTFYDNTTGLMISDSNLTQAYNNTFYGNQRHVYLQDSSRLNDPYLDQDPSLGIGGRSLTKYDQGSTWVTRKVVLLNNIFSDPVNRGGTPYQVQVGQIDTRNRADVTYAAGTDDDGADAGTAGTAKAITVKNPFTSSANEFIAPYGANSMNYNLYHRSSSTIPAATIRWDTETAGVSLKDYATVAAWRNADENGNAAKENSGYETNARLADNVSAGSIFVNAGSRNFALASSSPAIGGAIATVPIWLLAVAELASQPNYLGAVAPASSVSATSSDPLPVTIAAAPAAATTSYPQAVSPLADSPPPLPTASPTGAAAAPPLARTAAAAKCHHTLRETASRTGLLRDARGELPVPIVFINEAASGRPIAGPTATILSADLLEVQAYVVSAVTRIAYTYSQEMVPGSVPNAPLTYSKDVPRVFHGVFLEGEFGNW